MLLRSAAATVGIVAFVGAGVVGLIGVYFDPAVAKPDARSAAAYVSAQASEADLLFWPPDHPIAFYERSGARRGHVVSRPATVAADLNRLTAGRGGVFWEASDTVDNDPWGLVPFLLEKTAQPIDVRQFTGYRVYQYALRPGATFDLGALQPSSFRFGGVVELVGTAFGAPEDLPGVPADRPAWVSLRFRSLALLPPDLNVTVRLQDDEGNAIGQADVPLLDDRGAPTGRWLVGTEAMAVVLVRPQPGTPPTRARVEVGVYDPRTLAGLPLAGGMTASAPLGQLRTARPTQPPGVDALNLDRRLDLAGGPIDLLGLRLDLPAVVDAGDQLRLALFWQVRAPAASAPDLLLALQDDDGQARSPRSRPALADVLPPTDWATGDVLREDRVFAVDAGTPTGTYTLVIGLAGQDVALGQIAVRGRAAPLLTDLPPMAEPVSARFARGVELVGYRVGGDVRGGGRLTVTLFWRTDRQQSAGYTVFTHLVGPAGIVAQHDGPPAAGRAPTTRWLPGEIVADEHDLSLPATVAGDLSLAVGLYRLETGERLPLAAGGDQVRLGSIRVAR